MAASAGAAPQATGDQNAKGAGKGGFPPCVHCGRTNHPAELCFFSPEAKARKAAGRRGSIAGRATTRPLSHSLRKIIPGLSNLHM